MSTSHDRKSVNLTEGSVRMQGSREKPLAARAVKNKKVECPLENDVWIYRIVVGGLVASIVCAILGAAILQALGKDTPQLLTGLGMGALSGLTALLAPSPAKRARDSS